MANIILNGEKLKVFPLKSIIRQGCSFSSLLFNTVFEVLATATRRDKQTKNIQLRWEEVKLSLFPDGIILYTQNLKVSMIKQLEQIHEFSKVTGTRLINRYLLLFYMLIKNYWKEKARNQPSIYNHIIKNKISMYKLKQGGERSMIWKL